MSSTATRSSSPTSTSPLQHRPWQWSTGTATAPPDREPVPGFQDRCRAPAPPLRTHHGEPAWMWGALIVASITGWLHHLTAEDRDGRLAGHGVRPACPPRRRPDPAPATRTSPARAHPGPDPRAPRTVLNWPAVHGPDQHRNPGTLGETRPPPCPQHDQPTEKINTGRSRSAHALLADSGQIKWHRTV